MIGKTIYEWAPSEDAGIGDAHPFLPTCIRTKRVLRVEFYPTPPAVHAQAVSCWVYRYEGADGAWRFVDLETIDYSAWATQPEMMAAGADKFAEEYRAFGSVMTNVIALGSRAVTGEYADAMAWNTCARLFFNPFVPWMREQFPKHVEWVEGVYAQQAEDDAVREVTG